MNRMYGHNHMADSGPSAHIHSADKSPGVIIIYLCALLPSLLFGIFNIGYQYELIVSPSDMSVLAMLGAGLRNVVPQILATGTVTLLAEAIYSKLQRRRMRWDFIIPALMIPMMSPATTPAWMLGCSTLLAIVISLVIFYATERNVFNLTLLAILILYLLFPSYMSGPGVHVIDSMTSATPLTQVKVSMFTEPVVTDVSGRSIGLIHYFTGLIPGAWGETSTLCILAGAALLVITRVVALRLIISAFAGGMIMCAISWMCATPVYPATMINPLAQLCLGGFAFAVVFIASDSINSCITRESQYIYGFLLGILAMAMRLYSKAWPDSTLIAMLVMNLIIPIIDRWVVSAKARHRHRRTAIFGSQFKNKLMPVNTLIFFGIVLPLFLSWSVLPSHRGVGEEGIREGVMRACHFSDCDMSRLFNFTVKRAYIVNYHGIVIDRDPSHAMHTCINIGEEMKTAPERRRLPLWECATPDGIKYVLPLYGDGMRGPIQGFVSLNADGRTIYGAWFFPTHETPGLGERLTRSHVAERLCGLSVLDRRGELAPPVISAGGAKGESKIVQGMTGATLTGQCFNRIIKDCLESYAQYLRRISE